MHHSNPLQRLQRRGIMKRIAIKWYVALTKVALCAGNSPPLEPLEGSEGWVS